MVLNILMHCLILHSNTLIEVLLLSPLLQMKELSLGELSTLARASPFNLTGI